MTDKALFNEVEDIMYDQRIIFKELNAMGLKNNTPYIVLFSTRFRVAVALFTQALMPAVARIFYSYLRKQKIIFHSFRCQLIPTVVAFIINNLSRSLASVQRSIAYPLTLRSMRRSKILLNKDTSKMTCSDNNVEPQQQPENEQHQLIREKCVECKVLFTPSNVKEPMADVIFIHGLHGGLNKTWRQGQWRRKGHKLTKSNPMRNISIYNEDLSQQRQQGLKRSLSDTYWRTPKIAKTTKGINIPVMEGDWEIMETINVDEDYSNCWPQDWLPKDCPNVRVLALNYTTDILWCPVWIKQKKRTDMVERSNEMIDELLQFNVGKRPIIWVGHSKGGLFIKQILVNAWEHRHHKTEHNNLYSQTKGIMFYSVPHKGSGLADFSFPLLRRSVELMEIQKNCNFILNLHKKFLEICKENCFNGEIFSFIETSFTFMTFIYLRIVTYDSADPDIGFKCGVPLDHREICKPAGRDCFLYLELVKLIKKYTRKSYNCNHFVSS